MFKNTRDESLGYLIVLKHSIRVLQFLKLLKSSIGLFKWIATHHFKILPQKFIILICITFVF